MFVQLWNGTVQFSPASPTFLASNFYEFLHFLLASFEILASEFARAELCLFITEQTYFLSQYHYSNIYITLNRLLAVTTVHTVYTALECFGTYRLLFVSPPKRRDFHTAERTGLLWRSVNNSPIRYKTRYAPM